MTRARLVQWALLGVTALAGPLWAVGCEKASHNEATEGRDWRPVVDQIDEPLMREVLTADGWTFESDAPFESEISAEDVRSMGGRAEGDTTMRIWGVKKPERTASIAFVTFPGDVKPPTGGRGRSLGAEQLVAGSRSIDITVYDAEHNELTDEAEALMDKLIAAAEARIEN